MGLPSSEGAVCVQGMILLPALKRMRNGFEVLLLINMFIRMILLFFQTP
jgi:hypothetical protein